MYNNKAQVTIFIIIGIIIIVAFSLTFSSLKSKTLDSQFDNMVDTSLNTISIQQYVESCMVDITTNAVYFIASRGGYFDLPVNFFNELPPTAFYFYNYQGYNQDLVPTKDMMEIELSKYVNNQMEYCLDFSDYVGYELIVGVPKSSSSFGENNIVVDMDLPITIKSRDTVLSLKNFHISLDNDKLIKSLIVATNITKQIEDNPEILCFTCMFNIANKYGFDLNIDSYDESVYLFQLINGFNEDYNDKEYIFNFAISLEDKT